MSTDSGERSTEPYAVLLKRIDEWNGTTESALELRQEIKALRLPKGALGTERLQRVRTMYEKNRPPTAAKLLEDDGALADTMRPFIGDPDVGRWPFDEPERISDSAAVQWLAVLERGAAPDERLRAFVETMFATRRRTTWVPASYAFAALALRDETLRRRLLQRLAESFPQGIPEAWSRGVLAAPNGQVHQARHVFHAACVFLGKGGHLPGLSVAQLVSISLPSSDAADASAVLLGMRALLEHPDPSIRAAVVKELPQRARESKADEQQEGALRDLAESLNDAETPVRDVLVATLLAPRWRQVKGLAQVDALWSWLETARWLKRRGSTAEREQLAQVRHAAPDCETALRLALDEGLAPGCETSLDTARPRLRCLLDADEMEATFLPVLCLRLVELLCLFERPDLADQPWESVARIAMPGFVPVRRPSEVDARAASVRVLGRVELTLALARLKGEGVGVLLRDAELDEETVLRLAESQDGHVAGQVAVQLERLLREAKSPAEPGKVAPSSPAPAEQVKLLFRVFQHNPPSATFRKLRSNLRGRDTPLHRLVSALEDLDRARDSAKLAASTSSDALTKLNTAVKDAALALCSRSGDDLTALRTFLDQMALARGCQFEAELSRPGGRARFEALFASAGRWLEWLGGKSAGFRETAAKVADCFEIVQRASPGATSAQLGDFDQALSALLSLVNALPRPERDELRELLKELKAWAADQRGLAAECDRVCADATRDLDAAREEDLRKLLDEPNRLNRLRPEVTRRLHNFFFDNLAYREARRLRRQVGHRVHLPAVWTRLSPLIAGVAGGPLLMLDTGSNWNELAVSPNAPVEKLLATIALALGLSFGLLSANLSARMAPSNSAWRRVVTIAKRVMPLWLGSLIVAFLSSATTLWTLSDTSIGGPPVAAAAAGHHLAWQVALWTALAQFLGIFVGLILDGRQATRRGG